VQRILIGYFNNCNLASTDNALPEDGMTAPKHVGDILMQILKLFLKDNSLVNQLVNIK
jgi:hypothetical protein